MTDVRDTRPALWIAALAAALAIASVGGDNASERVTREAIAAVNAWGHYQAKAIRQAVARASTGEGDADVARYELEKLSIATAARAHEASRETALLADGRFDIAIAALQLAIVLATAFMVAPVRGLIGLSAAAAVAGVGYAIMGVLV